jgi:site-specific DNA-methyltransferase (adenine-specific)
MVSAALMMSNKQDWETPDPLFEALNNEFGFTLDVCAHDGNKKLPNYFSPSNDGLSQDWTGHVCWMNPPYGRDVYIWMKKAYEEAEKGATVVCLIAARTDTKYWHEFCMKASEIRLIKGRLKFKGAENSATFPSAIIVFDPACRYVLPIVKSYNAK